MASRRLGDDAHCTGGGDTSRVQGTARSTLGPFTLFLGLLLATGLLSGCIGATDEDRESMALASAGGQTHTETVIEDAEGDATEYNAGFLQGHANRCSLLGPAEGPCNEATSPVRNEIPEDAGVPAHPSLDLLNVHLTETPTELIVEIEVAEMTEDFDVIPDDHREKAAWSVWWAEMDDPDVEAAPWGGVMLTASRPSGVLLLEASYMADGPSCIGGGFCWLEIDFDVTPGTPGTIEFTVPRAFLAQEDANPQLIDIYALANRASWPVDRTVDWRVGDPGLGLSGGTFLPRWYEADQANSGAFSFELEEEPVDVSSYSRTSVEHPAGNQRAEVERPDLDILGIEIKETPREVTVVTEISLVEQNSESLSGWVLLSTNTDAGLAVGYDREDGELDPWAEGCHGTNCSEWGAMDVDAEVTVTPGSPGEIAISFPREVLGSPMEGDLVTWAWSEIWGADGVDERVEGLGDVAVERGLSGDWIMPFPLYVFEHDTQSGMDEAQEPTSTYRVEETEGDTEPPEFSPVAGDTSRFDVGYLEARMTHSQEMVFTIGMDSPLASTSPPPGYKTTVYAVGLETDEGAFMASYIDDGQTRPVFFCSADTVVLTEDRQDPSLVSGQPIEGLVSKGSTGPDGEPTSSGSITFFVPPSCLTREDPETIASSQLGAGSYLVPHTEQAGQDIVTMDDILADEAVIFGPEPITLASDPWYNEPLGIASFWDMMGLIIAITLAVGSILMVRRHRSLLKRYLADIQQAKTDNTGSAQAQETKLVEIQTRLREDLMNGRIPENHFVIVESRIEDSLSESRVSGLVDLFGDLPHRLLTNLETMLSDGVLSQQDYETLCALLDESPLKQEAKHAIQDRLAQWLEQDGSSKAPTHRLARP